MIEPITEAKIEQINFIKEIGIPIENAGGALTYSPSIFDDMVAELKGEQT